MLKDLIKIKKESQSASSPKQELWFENQERMKFLRLQPHSQAALEFLQKIVDTEHKEITIKYQPDEYNSAEFFNDNIPESTIVEYEGPKLEEKIGAEVEQAFFAVSPASLDIDLNNYRGE
ncbi:7981_t:CDS:2, partial [Ambispora gerdemannii]